MTELNDKKLRAFQFQRSASQRHINNRRQKHAAANTSLSKQATSKKQEDENPLSSSAHSPTKLRSPSRRSRTAESYFAEPNNGFESPVKQKRVASANEFQTPKRLSRVSRPKTIRNQATSNGSRHSRTSGRDSGVSPQKKSIATPSPSNSRARSSRIARRGLLAKAQSTSSLLDSPVKASQCRRTNDSPVKASRCRRTNELCTLLESNQNSPSTTKTAKIESDDEFDYDSDSAPLVIALEDEDNEVSDDESESSESTEEEDVVKNDVTTAKPRNSLNSLSSLKQRPLILSVKDRVRGDECTIVSEITMDQLLVESHTAGQQSRVSAKRNHYKGILDKKLDGNCNAKLPFE